MKKLLFLSLSLFAQSVNRNVILTWTASTTTGVTGYNVYRADAVIKIFTVLNPAPIPGTSYTDTTDIIGNSYLYEVTSITPACTSSTPVTTACGESQPSSPVLVPIPAKPTSSTGSIVVIVQ